MFDATLSPPFLEVAEHKHLTAVVHVVFRYGDECTHIVDIGPDGVQL